MGGGRESVGLCVLAARAAKLHAVLLHFSARLAANRPEELLHGIRHVGLPRLWRPRCARRQHVAGYGDAAEALHELGASERMLRVVLESSCALTPQRALPARWALGSALLPREGRWHQPPRALSIVGKLRCVDGDEYQLLPAVWAQGDEYNEDNGGAWAQGTPVVGVRARGWGRAGDRACTIVLEAWAFEA